jgi:putative membrane protein
MNFRKSPKFSNKTSDNQVVLMNRFVVRWLLNIVALVLTSLLIPGFNVTVGGAIVGAILLGLVNALIRPIFMVLTLPINILSLGLFTLVINGLMLWIVSLVVKGFNISSFGVAIIASLVLTLVSALLSWLMKEV